MFRKANDMPEKKPRENTTVPDEIKADETYIKYRKILTDITNADPATLAAFDSAFLTQDNIEEILFDAVFESGNLLNLDLRVPTDPEECAYLLEQILKPLKADDVVASLPSEDRKRLNDIGDWIIALNSLIEEKDARIYQIDSSEHLCIALRISHVNSDREHNNLLKAAGLGLIEAKDYW